MSLNSIQKSAFNQLVKAAQEDSEESLVLMACEDRVTGDSTPVICICTTEGEDITYTPVAKLFTIDPHKELCGPTEGVRSSVYSPT